MQFYGMHMHLHASHEPTASIGSHMAHASALGIKYLWLTEHDVRMGEKKRSLPYFALPKADLFSEMENGVRAGFRTLDGSSGSYSFINDGENIFLKMSARAGEAERLRFYSKGKNHSDPLFSGVSVEADIELILGGRAEFSLEFVLSEQPPSYTHARMIYTTGKLPEGEVDNVLYLPFPKRGANGKYKFELSHDTRECVGGLDNASCYIDLSLVGEGECIFKSFRFMRELDYEDVRQEQIKLAYELERKWGVTPFVTFEITGAGHHKNCYDTRVPCINYRERGFEVTEAEAIEHVISHGGIFCYNHPFTEWKNAHLSEEEKRRLVDELADRFTENRVLGATLMEVGFPYEKEDFYDRHYLSLWDKLSSRGVFISGDGDSDNHGAADDGWTVGNNFASYAGLTEGEDPCEESFRKAFIRGSIWCGDPTRIGRMQMTANGRDAMGAIFVNEALDIEFTAGDISCDGRLIRIVNGEVSLTKEIHGGECRDSFTLRPRAEIEFVRYEIRDAQGVLIALSNPVYTVKNDALIYETAKARKVTK